MLTDVALKQLKPQQKLYKVADRDGIDQIRKAGLYDPVTS
jgi:hypothetical protein